MKAVPQLRAPRRRAAAALVAAVLAVHAWLLAGLPFGPGAARDGGHAALTMRQIVVVPPPEAAPGPAHEVAAEIVPALAAAAAPEPAAPAIARAAADAPSTTPSAEAAASAPPDDASAAAAAPQDDERPAAAAARTEGVAEPTGGTPVPTYATRLPPPAVLHYEIHRGPLAGIGQLRWQPGPEGYLMAIESTAFGMPLLAWVSRGGYDEAGLAPQRFVDRRRGRPLRAANFQRDAGLITYSASALEHALLPGAQDRLSWLAQIAGIVEADPARFEPGSAVVMQVVGARGDADVWTLAVMARETIELPGGRIEAALRLRRDPRRAFDTLVEVWLDPQRHHLPVRLRLTQQPGNETLEFVLRAGSP